MVSCPGLSLPWPRLNCVPGLLAPPAERIRCVEASCRQESCPQHSALLRALCWRLRQPAQSRQPHRAVCHSAPSSSSGTLSRRQARPCAPCCRGRRSSASLSASLPPVPAPQHLPAECAIHAMPVSTATLPVPRAPRYVYSDTVTKPRWQLIMHQLSQATRLPPSPTHATRRAPPPHGTAPPRELACGTALRPLAPRAEASVAVRAACRLEADHRRAALRVGAAHLLLRGRRPAARAVRAARLPRHTGHRAAPPYSVVPLVLQLASLQRHPALPVAAASRWHLAAGRRRRGGCNHTHERLQPYVSRLQPYVSRLQPYAQQVSGYALPFTQPGPKDRDRWEPPSWPSGCNPIAPRLQPCTI